MSRLADVLGEGCWEKQFDQDGHSGAVWAEFTREFTGDGDTLSVTHVEADPRLRNTGAAGRFMEALVQEARDAGVKLRPVCAYAVHWMTRHPESHDVLRRG